MIELHAVVVRIDIGAKLNFLELVGVVMLTRFLVLFCLFVTELAKVHQTTHWRCRIRGDFDQINTMGLGHADGLVQRVYAQLFAIVANDPHFTSTDLAVDSDRGTGGRRGTRRKGATQAALTG